MTPPPMTSPGGDHLAGKVVVVTGATSGIGLAAATELAGRGAQVVLVGRDRERLESAVATVRARALLACEGRLADFAELEQVRALGAALARAHPRIDVLACNAGVAMARRVITVDGHELGVQTNHLAHFLLAHLLRPRLRGGRIVVTASSAHWAGRLDPDTLDRGHRRHRLLPRYGTTKRMNVLFAAEAARRWPDTLAVSFHPGVVRTRAARHSRFGTWFLESFPGLRSPEQAAQALIQLAVTPLSGVRNGAYHVDGRPARTHPQAADPDVAQRLWRASERAVGLVSS